MHTLPALLILGVVATGVSVALTALGVENLFYHAAVGGLIGWFGYDFLTR